ncbi:hypothetical protein [Delftia sp.]|uniref:hypothetical protein n=1 Tax=Delftia sp. TaxID=1886637 RepID=UPI00259CC158|nr:hypothetical protein [Delftia sp.]
MTDIIAPPTISALPPAPLATDTPTEFDAKAFAMVAAQVGFVPQANALASNVYNNATAAFERTTIAQAAASASSGSASEAAGSASAASGSASAAASSASTAASAASSATAALASMQVMYLGSKPVNSHPTTDNMGNTLQAGALYTNTGTNASINKRGWWWDGAMWQLAWGEFTGAYLPITGGVLQGHLSVPAGATGNQVPRANEVMPRAAAYYSTATPMSASPPGTVGFFESTTGGGTDWPMQGSLTVHGWVVETWDRGGVRTVQTATFAMASGSLAQGTQFRRYQVDGVWYPWARAVSDLDFREKVYATSTGVGPGDAKVYYLDPSKGSIHQLTVQYNTYFTGALRGLGDQITLRLKFSGGAWPISFNTNFRFPAGAGFPTYASGQTLTMTFFNTEGSYIDGFIAGVHNP